MRNLMTDQVLPYVVKCKISGIWDSFPFGSVQAAIRRYDDLSLSPFVTNLSILYDGNTLNKEEIDSYRSQALPKAARVA